MFIDAETERLQRRLEASESETRRLRAAGDKLADTTRYYLDHLHTPDPYDYPVDLAEATEDWQALRRTLGPLSTE